MFSPPFWCVCIKEKALATKTVAKTFFYSLVSIV